MGFAAVVLAGGAGRRMGGRPDVGVPAESRTDFVGLKPLLPVGGTPMLSRVLAAVADADPRVVVGPDALAPALPPGVVLAQEEPPGGGPVPAAAAGLALLPAGVPLVALLAADLPFLTGGTIEDLRSHVTSCVDGATDGAVLVDADGRPQWLCGVWRTDALRSRLHDLTTRGAGMRDVAAGLRVARVAAPTADAAPAWFDCDTEDDMRRAEEWADGSTGAVDG